MGVHSIFEPETTRYCTTRVENAEVKLHKNSARRYDTCTKLLVAATNTNIAAPIAENGILENESNDTYTH